MFFLTFWNVVKIATRTSKATSGPPKDPPRGPFNFFEGPRWALKGRLIRFLAPLFLLLRAQELAKGAPGAQKRPPIQVQPSKKTHVFRNVNNSIDMWQKIRAFRHPTGMRTSTGGISTQIELWIHRWQTVITHIK